MIADELQSFALPLSYRPSSLVILLVGAARGADLADTAPSRLRFGAPFLIGDS